MPRSIKPRMSKDELASLDAGVHSVEYDDGEAFLTITNKFNDDVACFWMSEKDCEDIISFIRRNQV